MPKFRRKERIIEATQWFKYGDHPAVRPVRGKPPYPPGATTFDFEADANVGFLSTPSGEQMVRPGDWVLPEPDGSGFYPCTGKAFAELYEPAE